MYRLFFILCILVSTVACPQAEVCKTSKDCRAGLVCDTSIARCVECFENANCVNTDFCCQGKCRSEKALDQYCGCETSPLGRGGIDCAKQYAESHDIGGPMCIFGGATLSLANISQASCSCLNDSDCRKGANGLQKLCRDNICISQNAEDCGNHGICSPSNGGNLCLPEGNNPLGVCGCHSDSVSLDCMTPVGGHIIADRCDLNSKCKCGSQDPCAVTGEKTDCCSGECVDFSKDPNNCGQCGKRCLKGICIQGMCGCENNAECRSSTTNRCGRFDEFAKSLCVCSWFIDKEGNQAACKQGKYCCANTETGAIGCCSKPCNEAAAQDCMIEE